MVVETGRQRFIPPLELRQAVSYSNEKNASYVIFPQGGGEIAIKREEGMRLWCHRDERASRKVAPTAVLRRSEISRRILSANPSRFEFQKVQRSLFFLLLDPHLPDSSLPSNFIYLIALTRIERIER